MTLARHGLVGCVALVFALFVGAIGPAADDTPPSPQLGGIGVRIGMQGDGAVYPSVMEVSPGGPAAASGIASGDRLVGIVDETGQLVDFQGRDLGEIAALVRGPSGSTLRLVVETKGSEGRRLYELVRAAPPVGTAAGTAAAKPAAQTARVHFFRESGFVGSMLNYRIEHNGRAIGNLGNGAYFSYDSPPGQQSFAAVGNFGRGGTFTFEPGQTYYIELSVVPFSASLQLVARERGGEAIRSIR
jgi:PDZ domain-containing protein